MACEVHTYTASTTHRTAEVERGFSERVNLMKTNIRNKLFTPILENLLTVRSGSGQITTSVVDSADISMYNDKKKDSEDGYNNF